MIKTFPVFYGTQSFTRARRENLKYRISDERVLHSLPNIYIKVQVFRSLLSILTLGVGNFENTHWLPFFYIYKVHQNVYSAVRPVK